MCDLPYHYGFLSSWGGVPSLALEDEAEPGLLAGPGPFVTAQQNKHPLEPGVSGEFPEALWRLPLHARPPCITCTWVLPQAWGPSQVWAPCCLSVIAGSSPLRFPSPAPRRTGLQSKRPSCPHPSQAFLAPCMLHHPPLATGPEALTDSRWLFGIASCPSRKQTHTKKKLEIS